MKKKLQGSKFYIWTENLIGIEFGQNEKKSESMPTQWRLKHFLPLTKIYNNANINFNLEWEKESNSLANYHY